MAFPDFPFDPHLPSFISHTDVAIYLERYAQHFGLHGLIKFSTSVDKVCRAPDRENKWVVTYSSVDNRQVVKTDMFNSVIVCNGHYTVPLIPDLPGMNVFKGEITHSHNYRVPDVYKGKRVILLGAGASGQDIALDISSTATKVFLSSRKAQLKCTLPSNMWQVSCIKYLTENSAVLEGGERVDVDCLLLCTGYKYHFPFLDQGIGLTVDDDQRVTPLYKHIFHTEYPTLCFIGLCKTVCPFPHFNIQAVTIISVLSGNAKLPTRQEMAKDENDDLASRLALGLPRRYAHLMGRFQWNYTKELVELGRFPDPIPPGVKELYDYIHKTRVTDLMGYKKSKYQLDGQNSFRVLD